jgi:3-methyl-2-oxobutanoate hydroxymethyltransferase
VSLSRARAIIGVGIPVLGHVGLTPQTPVSLGGWKTQGRNAEAAELVTDPEEMLGTGIVTLSGGPQDG